jgi:hypothetical protein
MLDEFLDTLDTSDPQTGHTIILTSHTTYYKPALGVVERKYLNDTTRPAKALFNDDDDDDNSSPESEDDMIEERSKGK